MCTADLVSFAALGDLGIELDVAFGDAEFLAELAVQGGGVVFAAVEGAARGGPEAFSAPVKSPSAPVTFGSR
jgi:hypothetical protein